MPRPAPRSKPGKQKSRPSVMETMLSEPEQEVEYISASQRRLNQINVLIQKDTDETVGEIIDELLSKVMDVCYKVYTERQLAPYSASWAKNYLTWTLEHQILCLDEGEVPEEICRTEDFDPVPATPDSWAQGCVPVVYASDQPYTSQQEVDIDLVAEQTKSSVEQDCNAVCLTNSPAEQAEIETMLRKPVNDSHCFAPISCTPAKMNKKSPQQVNIPPKKLPCKLLPPLSSPVGKKVVEVESYDTEDTALKPKTESAPRHKDRQPIPKLDPSHLPQLYVFPEYEIVDLTKPNPKKPGGLPRLEPNSNKQQTVRTVTSLKPLISSKDLQGRFQKRREDDICLSKYDRERHVLSGLLRQDTTVLTKNVSLLKSQAAESNPQKPDHLSQPTKMRPIQNDAAVPLYSVAKVTAGPPPRVTPLIQTKHHDSSL